jgi:DNA-3-methyladenine glycosylase II
MRRQALDSGLASPLHNRNSRGVSKRALAHLRADPALAGLIDRIGPPKLSPRRVPPFQALSHAIIHQQLSGQAAGTILRRFLALFGSDGFPAPLAVLGASPEQLRSAGLSRPKASYVLGLAQKAVEGYLPTLEECDRMTDAEMIERLTSIKGVGRWTAEMLLIFNLGRPDVLPVHDLGVRKGFQFAYRKRKLPEPEQLARYGVRWAPHRTTAAWYLWRAADFLDGEGW